jgi:DNA topoisomerase-3
MTIAVVAEKPAVARDIAKVLGAGRRGTGFLQGNGYIVTWAIGHLVTLAQPHEMNAQWRAWRRDLLPMLPQAWPLVVSERTRDQFAAVREVINGDSVERLVCATDAGREGELIFRYIYEAAGCLKPVSRLWISSLTPEAIREGFRKLRDGQEMEPLADAARGRSRADWLVGLNLSRACTLAFDEKLSVGRVQTPTLAMLVEREQAIRAFVPEDYLEVVATFGAKPASGPETESDDAFEGTWFRGEKPEPEAKRLPPDGEEAGAIVDRVRGGRARIESLRSETKRLPPPLLYDLTELQRHANRLYGFSAEKTLSLAQGLYEQKKLISYPRTDSRHLSTDVAATLPDLVKVVCKPYTDLLAPGTGERSLGRRFVDDGKVTDHHAILPTKTSPDGVSLSRDEERIYDLVCRRLLAAWHQDHLWSVTNVITAVSSGSAQEAERAILDRFHSTGTLVQQMGWRVLDVRVERGKQGQPGKDPKSDTKSRDGGQSLPSGLTEGQPQEVLDAKAVQRRTRPPRRFTDATLLTAMETAGRTLDDKELSAAMKDKGLGTPATRAEIIETLIRREFVVRERKTLAATDKGIRLIERVHPEIKSPAMTGEWEARLRAIQRREGDLASFMAGIEEYVRDAVGKVFGSISRPVAESLGAAVGQLPDSPSKERPASEPAPDAGLSPPPTIPPPSNGQPPPSPADPSPTLDPASAGEGLQDQLRNRFHLTSFRPHQEPVCRAVLEGRDSLVVMPTGSGKSLCYQLPGLARGGTTLVISPLIALMEDQVAKLQGLGLRAECIHSGRDRLSSREVCRRYLQGSLDYLFIAPERLRVPGFPEMLAKRKPVLVAVDEAHCISHWGHDFRPDYRMLGERLPLLRPAPVIALTATATPRVQEDIVRQLEAGSASRFIHGFRRTNIAVEVVEMAPSQRAETVHRILDVDERRPAIVYAPTRKEAEGLGAMLQGHFPAAAYHAGMPAQARERVQQAFLRGDLQVIVATIAFGMGVDKPDIRTIVHTALPATLEGYYQEIGRAGRNGLPSRAILLYSYADRRTHEFFQERDYPEPRLLSRVYDALGEPPQPKQVLLQRLGMEPETLDPLLEKLWIHGGLRIRQDDQGLGETLARGEADWRTPYEAQRKHRQEQLEAVTRFAAGHECRMLHLVRHFGDQEDSGDPCGICDLCAPSACLVQGRRPATEEEREIAAEILGQLRAGSGRSTGQLHRSLEHRLPDRRAFERILGALAASGLVEVREASFEKDGRTIRYQQAVSTPTGRQAKHSLEDLQVKTLPAQAAGSAGRTKRPKAAKTPPPPSNNPPPSPELVAALKEWRLEEARHREVPAFHILHDRTLMAIAAAHPQDQDNLLAVRGMGPGLMGKYGEAILKILGQHSGD